MPYNKMPPKPRLIPEKFDKKKGLNNVQLKDLNQKPKTVAKIPLDSGAIARLQTFDQPIDRRGPFDIGLLETWIVYIILFLLILASLAGLVLVSLGLNMELFSIASTKNQEVKLFGVCLTSCVFTSSTILLFCFGCQHAKEVGWLPNAHYSNDYVDTEPLTDNAKISALYSIDPNLQQQDFPPTSPSQIETNRISTPQAYYRTVADDGNEEQELHFHDHSESNFSHSSHEFIHAIHPHHFRHRYNMQHFSPRPASRVQSRMLPPIFTKPEIPNQLNPIQIPLVLPVTVQPQVIVPPTPLIQTPIVTQLPKLTPYVIKQQLTSPRPFYNIRYLNTYKEPLVKSDYELIKPKKKKIKIIKLKKKY